MACILPLLLLTREEARLLGLPLVSEEPWGTPPERRPIGFRETDGEPQTVLMLLDAGFDALTVGAFCSALGAGSPHPRYRILFASASGGLLEGVGGLQVSTHSPHEVASEEIDILLLVGGGEAGFEGAHPLEDWVQRAGERGCRIYAFGRGIRLARGTAPGLGDDAPVASRAGTVWASPGAGAAIDIALLILEEDHGASSAWRAASTLRMANRRFADDPSVGRVLRLQARASSRFALLLGELSRNPAMRADVESLAARSGMSLRTFTRRFRRETGTTPASAVEAVRLEAARAMLRAGGMTMKDIARSSGFGSDAKLRTALRRDEARAGGGAAAPSRTPVPS